MVNSGDKENYFDDLMIDNSFDYSGNEELKKEDGIIAKGYNYFFGKKKKIGG